MANEQNLKPFTSEQNREEAVKNGRKGGIASGESKREKKSLKNALLALLEAKHTNKKGQTLTGYEIVATGLMNKASKGGEGATKLISELIGEYKLRTDVTSNGESIGMNIIVKDKKTKSNIEKLMQKDVSEQSI